MRWVSSRGRPSLDAAGRPVRLTGLSVDVSERKRAGQESRDRLEFETRIADLSCRFINLPPGDVDREIEASQRRVCEVLGLDLSALWQGTAAARTPFTLTHFYSAQEGLLPPMGGSGAGEHFPWLQREMLAAHGEEDQPGATPDDGGVAVVQPWPGNVRELKNTLEHGAILTTGDTLRMPMLDETAPAPAGPAEPTLADTERRRSSACSRASAGASRGRTARPRPSASTPRPSTAV